MPASFSIDPAWITGPASALFLLLIVGYYWRKDINDRNQLDREDRAKERAENAAERTESQRLYKETISELTTTFKQSISELKGSFSELSGSHQAVAEKVIARGEETERLSEARYNLLLTQTLKMKGEPPPP